MFKIERYLLIFLLILFKPNITNATNPTGINIPKRQKKPIKAALFP
jgi:hypothetical protein